MSGYRIISADDRVFEPRDLWTDRGEPRFKDRMPRVVRLEDGSEWWYCDGRKGTAVAGGAQVGKRFHEPESLGFESTWEEVRPGGYIAEEHVKDMDLDGIDRSILYPTVALFIYSMPDGELMTSVFRTYNDWIAEFCQGSSGRLNGIAMLNIDDVGQGIGELERCANLGLVGAMIPVFPPVTRPYDSPEYEPLWAAAEDLEMPLSLHVGSNRPAQGADSFADIESVNIAFFSNIDYWVRMSLAHMICSGVFERHPSLRVGSIEQDLAWAPYFLDRLDYNYTQRARGFALYRFKGDALPSDFFHTNVFLGFQEDGLGIRDRHIIGVENFQWGSDYPHMESTFPRSREILEEILADCTEGEKAKIAGGNAARVYRLD